MAIVIAEFILCLIDEIKSEFLSDGSFDAGHVELVVKQVVVYYLAAAEVHHEVRPRWHLNDWTSLAVLRVIHKIKHCLKCCSLQRRILLQMRLILTLVAEVLKWIQTMKEVLPAHCTSLHVSGESDDLLGIVSLI